MEPGKEPCQTQTRPPAPRPPGPPTASPLPVAPTACDKRRASGLCRIFRKTSTSVMATRFSEVVVSFLETKKRFFLFPFFGNNSWEYIDTF